jgi:hypothetical protein
MINLHSQVKKLSFRLKKMEKRKLEDHEKSDYKSMASFKNLF